MSDISTLSTVYDLSNPSILTDFTTVYNLSSPSLLANLFNKYGTEGNDTLYGNSLHNYIYGYGGNDCLSGAGGDDTLLDGDGNDTLSGGDGNDYLSAGSGDDRLFGGNGSDNLVGDDGNDFLLGTHTDIWDSYEYDTLTGGNGADTFALRSWKGPVEFSYEVDGYQGAGYATITDFKWWEGDKIEVAGWWSDYTLDMSYNWSGGSGLDTAIYLQNDLIAIVQDITTVNAQVNFI